VKAEALAWPIVLAAVLAVGFAPAPFARPHRQSARDDGRRLDGTWVVKKVTHKNREYGGAVVASFRFEQADRLAISGGELRSLEDESHPRFAVRLRGKREIDLMAASGRGRRLLGIYRLQGGILTLSLGPSDKTRPEDFSEDNITIVLEREEP
jgi:uncharacterized protein (TIGR03067 family)